MHRTQPRSERAFLVAVDAKGNGKREQGGAVSRGSDPRSSLEELGRLVDTAHGVVVGETVQRLDAPHPGYYVGRGKAQEIASACRANGSTLVVFDDELSPSQQRNLERVLNLKVLDRTALILDIFAMRARTREGQLQVDLAQSEYLLPRLAGQWSHLERLGGSGRQGSIGVRGPGETQLETDRRQVRNKIARLKRELEGVRRQRSLHRRRRARVGIPVVALVGYTNAGKSTLMRALTNADVLVEDQLFATLDPTTRRIALSNGHPALLTDTVGFIEKLPAQLIAAFRATLEELTDADLLLHVVDVTHPNAAQQSQTVENLLGELELLDKPRITALNKVDRLSDSEGRAIGGLDDLAEYELSLAQNRPDAVLISAARKWGIDELLTRVQESLKTTANAAAGRRPPQGDVWPAYEKR